MIEHLQKQKEIGALKIGYAAQAEAFVYAASQVKRLYFVLKGSEEFHEMTGTEIPVEAKREMLQQYAQALSTTFFVTDSLKLHFQTFGKFPEWTRFLRNVSPEELHARIDLVERDYESLGETTTVMTDGKSKVGQRHNIYSAENVAFFESIKIEGEE